jgi:cytochrome P450
MTQTRKVCPVVDFDHRSRELSQNRERISRELRAHPICYTEAWDGFYVVTSYDLARTVFRDTKTFASTKEHGQTGVAIPPTPVPLIPAELDPPEQTDIRRVLNPIFSRQAMEQLRPTIVEIIAGTLDDVIAKGEFDIVHDLAEVIPAKVILTFMGFSPDERETMVLASQNAMNTAEDPERAAQGFAQMRETVENLIARRRDEAADDATSRLIHQDEYEFPADQLFWTIFTLNFGGTENVAALIANILLHLFQDSALRTQLADHPELMPEAVEEFLRFFTPGGGLARTVTRDVDLGDVSLKAGDRVLLWLPSANKDDSKFSAPDAFKLGREERTPHLSFAQGPHFCVGAELARIEVGHLINEVLRRMPDYWVDIDRSVRFDNSGNMYGWWSMPAKANL